MKARKRFGQNFLRDPTIIDRIGYAIAPVSDDHILEIGPGHGALTERLVASKCELDLVEIDRDLVAELEHRFPQVKIHSADILNFNLRSVSGTRKLRIVGNLPYNISTPLLFKLFEDIDLIQDMFFMLQLEVVNRLIAEESTSQYGRLSIMSQQFCFAEKMFDVPPEAFTPRPKVNSAIVKLTPHSKRATITDQGLFERMLIQVFSQRRKTLRNAMKPFLSESELVTLEIDPQARPENLPGQQYVNCANYVSQRDSG